ASSASAASPRLLRALILPAAPTPPVLLAQPAEQGPEIFDHRLGADLAGASEGLDRLRPGPREAEREHLVQPPPDVAIAVEGTAMERPVPAGNVAGGLEELELQDAGKEVAGVGHARRDVIFGAGV